MGQTKIILHIGGIKPSSPGTFTASARLEKPGDPKAPHLDIEFEPRHRQEGRTYIFLLSDLIAQAFRQQFEDQLRRRLSELAGDEFAEASITAFDTNPAFVNAGAFDLYFFINPGETAGSSTVERIRFELWNAEAEVRARSWEGSPEVLVRKYQLDFSRVLDTDVTKARVLRSEN